MNSNLFPQQKLSVLMVDDHAMMRDAYKRILSTIQFVGFVEVASSGEQAIEILKQKNFDMVLMDYKFSGGMKGSEATKWITEQKPLVKVIGISSNEFLNIGIEFMISGAKGFLKKVWEMKSWN
jgi:DNA-binding NarL/FixJ family response regulator